MDHLLSAGMSHCVNHTLRDLMKNWRSEMSKLVLLTDGSSPVPGFEFAVDLLMTDARTMGVTVTTTDEVFEIRNSGSLHGGRQSVDYSSSCSVSIADDLSTHSGPHECSHSAPATSRVAAESPTNLAGSSAAKKMQQQVNPVRVSQLEPVSSVPAPGDSAGKKISPRSAKVAATSKPVNEKHLLLLKTRAIMNFIISITFVIF